VIAVSRKNRVLHDDTIRALEQRHFLLFDIVPAVAALAAVPILWRVGVGWIGAVSFVVMWVLNLVGVEIGFHRLFSHAAFRTTPAVRAVLTALGSMGAQGPVISWAANHRHHHQFSDGPEDSHSPARGFLHAHLFWKRDYPYPSPSHYARDLVRDRAVVVSSRYYMLWIALGIALPALIGALVGGGRGALQAGLCGGVLRLVLGQHATWCINSVCHLWGRRDFESGDRSTNNAWLALPSLGGSWHNTHHAFPSTANNGLLPGHFDACFWILRGMEWCGLAWDLKQPTPAQVAARRLRA
jgi:stearoyl-CoA desaturase (delta-9 desaturase)